MPSANLDLVRSISAAWERGDFSHSAEWADPEIEFVIADGPSPGSWTGLARMEDGWRDFLGAWQDARQDTDGYRELDEERVLVLTRLNARGKTSGVNVRQTGTRQAGLFHVRHGKVTRLVYYLDRDRALTDLGLASDAGTADPPG
jgi:ketosteroid isomerase-like protein